MASWTIGNGTRHYTSIQAWEDAAPATLTEIWEGLLYPEGAGSNGEWVIGPNSPNAAVMIGGSTATASFYKRLACAPGHSFRDKADKNSAPLRYDSSRGVAIATSGGSYGSLLFIAEPYAEVDGLQLKHGVFNGGCVQVTDGTLRNSILFANAPVAATYGYALIQTNGSDARPARVINCMIYTGRAENTGVNSGIAPTANTIVESCTVIKASSASAGGSAMSRGYGKLTARNTLALGQWSSAFNGTFEAVSGNNGTDKASAPGSNNLVNLVAVDQVQNMADTTNFDGRLRQGNSVGAGGSRQQALTGDLDILGNARSTTAPAIGAYEGGVSAGILLSQLERGRVFGRGFSRGMQP